MVRHRRLGSPKVEEREEAIDLRRKGLSYREILKRVPVAKSTLSVWLSSVALSKHQKQRLTEKRLAAALRGAAKRKKQRIDSTQAIISKARQEVGKLSKRELWLIGCALYWAEGTKEKEYRPNIRVDFSNSDPYMAQVFMEWLQKSCQVTRDQIKASIYIHENSRRRMHEVIEHWSQWTGLPKEELTSFVFKKHTPKTNRRNIGHTYYGNVRIRVSASTNLARTIAGWIEGIHRT